MKASTLRTRNISAAAILLCFAAPAHAARALALPLAQVPGELKTAFQSGLGILFLVGFFWGVINIWGGAEKLKRGDAEGKMGLVSGIIIAGAAMIMGALFTIFGMGDGVLQPQF